jgi:hypothetical protein
MTVEEALAIVDALLAPERLSSVQEMVFRHCWDGQTYYQVAQSAGYDADYIRLVGSRLWQTLSQASGEKVTKHNLHAVLRQHSSNVPTNNVAVTQVVEPSDETKLLMERSLVLEFPGDPLALASPFYVECPAINADCYQEIAKPGGLIRIKAPEKRGKTSLLTRSLARAKALGYQTVRLNLQQVEQDVLSNLDRFLRWFCANITQQLELESKLDDYWDADLGSKISCTTYLQGYVLVKLENPLVIALDEVHRLFEYPAIAQDFLPLLRVWHEEANNLDTWSMLRLVVAYSTEVYIPLDLNQSPFNVGLPIRLPKFDLEQTQDFAFRHDLELAGDELGLPELIRLREMVDGHPYLLHLAFYHLCREEVSIDHLLENAPTQTGIYSNHLRGHLTTLQQHPELAAAFKEVVEADNAIQLDAIPAYKLESMGLVNLIGDMATPGCDLYRLYFRDRLSSLSATVGDRLIKEEPK